jgi:molybdopterin-synthase adenylyltransferase
VKLSDAQIELYSRQIILRELGGRGQAKLLAGRALLAGGGFAARAALSYLAGAGIGEIHLLPGTIPEESCDAPFAPAAERSPDVRIEVLAADRAAALDRFDVAIVVRGRAPGDALRLDGCPRSGTVCVAPGDDAIGLLLVPQSARGCFACVDANTAALGSPYRSAGADVAPPEAALGQAGAMAALVACRWIAGIGGETRARALVLPAGAPVWLEADVLRDARCPRGCRASE